jgi:hypothetical protein
LRQVSYVSGSTEALSQVVASSVLMTERSQQVEAEEVGEHIKVESECLMKAEEGGIKTEEGNVETQEIPIRTNEVPIKLEVKRERDPSDDRDVGDRSDVEVVRDARPAKKRFLGIVDLTDE